jgi:predicted RNA-binding Zn ribbon-like protein
MGEAKVGQEFIKHELDEAIAIQRTIVTAEEQLSGSHPEAESKRAIERFLKQDQKFLQKLEQLGQEVGATGEVEEVAGSMQELMQTTLQTAEEAPSEAYEAHAVLLNLKRKQQDSAAAMLKIAREMKNTEMRDAASEFEKATKESANELADQLSTMAVNIATEQGSAAPA